MKAARHTMSFKWITLIWAALFVLVGCIPPGNTLSSYGLADDGSHETASIEPAVLIEEHDSVSVHAASDKTGALKGEAVTFTASVQGSADSLSYKWQRSLDGESWSVTKLGGYNTAQLSFAANELRLSYYYRCAVSIGGETYYTNTVKVEYVDVNATPTPEPKPSASAAANLTTAKKGEQVDLTATVLNMSSDVSYKWQRSLDGEDWIATTLSGYKTAQLSFAANELRLSYYYRCAVSDGSGTYYTNAVKVEYVDPSATPTPAPTSGASASANLTTAKRGEQVEITATALNMTGDVSYKWQRSLDGEDWIATTLSGYKTEQLTFAANELRLSYYYRCAVSDGTDTYYTNAVKIEYVGTSTVPTTAPTPMVTPSPTPLPTPVSTPYIIANAEPAVAAAGELITLTARAFDAEGEVSYKWYRSEDGERWIATGLNGYNTDTLTFKANATRLSYYYRCAAIYGGDTYYSNAVSVEFIAAPTPAPTPYAAASSNVISAAINENVVITAEAHNMTGDVSFRWYRSQDGETWIKTALDGYNTAELSFKANSLRLGYSYRCMVSDELGSYYTNAVRIELITANPTATAAPTPVSTPATTPTPEPTATLTPEPTAIPDPTPIPVAGVQIKRAGWTEVLPADTTKKVTLGARIIPTNAANKGINWYSSDESVATITPAGVLTILGRGDVTISVATDDGGFTDSIVIHVIGDTPPEYSGAALTSDLLTADNPVGLVGSVSSATGISHITAYIRDLNTDVRCACYGEYVNDTVYSLSAIPTIQLDRSYVDINGGGALYVNYSGQYELSLTVVLTDGSVYSDIAFTFTTAANASAETGD